MTGKGSAPRPLSVDAETFADNFAKTFSRVVDESDPGYDDRDKACPPLETPPEVCPS